MLMYSKDDTVITRQDLTAIPTPAHTRSWRPVPFATFIDLAQDVCENHGLRFGEEQYILARGNTQLFAMTEILGLPAVENGRYLASWRSSLNKSLSAGGCFGKNLTVCTNLDLWGALQFGRKQTTFVMADLRQRMSDFIAGIAAAQVAREALEERYQRAQMSDVLANHAVIRMLQLGIINTQRVERVVSEYYEPTHVEHLTDGKRTNWTLFNAATEALKGSPIATMPQRTTALHTLIGNATDVTLAAAA